LTDDDLKVSIDVLFHAHEFARLTKWAREARRKGQIKMALGYEGTAEGHYRQLPEEYRW